MNRQTFPLRLCVSAPTTSDAITYALRLAKGLGCKQGEVAICAPPGTPCPSGGKYVDLRPEWNSITFENAAAMPAKLAARKIKTLVLSEKFLDWLTPNDETINRYLGEFEDELDRTKVQALGCWKWRRSYEADFDERPVAALTVKELLRWVQTLYYRSSLLLWSGGVPAVILPKAEASQASPTRIFLGFPVNAFAEKRVPQEWIPKKFLFKYTLLPTGQRRGPVIEAGPIPFDLVWE